MGESSDECAETTNLSTHAFVDLLPSELLERLRSVMVRLRCRPSIRSWPPSSANLFNLRLSSHRLSLRFSALPRCLPPSEWI